jgi:hypothetical protein
MAYKSAALKMAEADVTHLRGRGHGLDHEINNEIREQVLIELRKLRANERITAKERCMMLTSYTRIQYIFISLRKEGGLAPNAGASVRKYEAAFKTNDARRRLANARSAGPAEPNPEPPEPDDGFDPDIFDDDA